MHAVASVPSPFAGGKGGDAAASLLASFSAELSPAGVDVVEPFALEWCVTAGDLGRVGCLDCRG